MANLLSDLVREISRDLIAIQGPIRILDAVKWSPEIEAKFLSSHGRELPDVNTDTYQRNPLGFSPEAKLEELRGLRRKITTQIGEADGLGGILRDIVDGYERAVQMLEARGTTRFGELSCSLWGSALTPFGSGDETLWSHSQDFHLVLSGMDRRNFHSTYAKTLSAAQVVSELKLRFQRFEFLSQIEVRESDGIVSDAAAGGHSIKIRPDAMFSAKDVDILEVHEGYTHVATSLNGRAQTYAQWLGYGPPRSTATQEGLAVLMETLTMSTYPQRVKKVNDRVRIMGLAEKGADAVEVYRFLLSEGYSEKDSYRMMMRIFRGTNGRGGSPFTKDLSYMKGLIECYNFVYSCLAENAADYIRFLYAGKVKLEDIPILIYHSQSGLIEPPRWLPPVFLALDELASWFIFPAQLGHLNDRQMQSRFRSQIRQYAGA
jgi:uncharacterized protein (TIGR02421 family)